MCLYIYIISILRMYIYIHINSKFSFWFQKMGIWQRKHLKSIMVVSTKKMSLWKRMVSTLSPKIPFESLASLVISPNKCEQHKCWTSPPCIMQIKQYKTRKPHIIQIHSLTSSSKFCQKNTSFSALASSQLSQPISVGTKEPPNASHQNTLFVFFRGFLQMRCLQLAFLSALKALLCSLFGALVGTNCACYCWLL